MKVLVNGRAELLITPLQQYFQHLKIIPLIDLIKSNDYSSPFSLKKIIKTHTFDIVHMNSRFDSILFFKRKGIKYIFESHAIHP